MIVAYARKTTDESFFQQQLNALCKEEFVSLFVDDCRENLSEHSEFERLLNRLHKGDTLLIYRLDCLGKTLYQLEDFIRFLSENEIRFVSLSEQIDISDYEDSDLVKYLKVFIRMDSNLKSELTNRGILLARRAGRVGGRPKITEDLIEKIHYLYEQKKYSLRQIAAECNLSLGTVHKYAKIKDEQEQE